MDKRFGIWIDHRKAVIVRIEGKEEEILEIKSNIEKRVRLSGGSRSSTPYGPQDTVSEGQKDRKYLNHLEQYYDKIALAIKGAEALIILGPGEAKMEFKKYLEKSKELGPQIEQVETADKMTDRQIAAKVRKYFIK
jgi:stalled ribosome rescue protein Dom34